MTLEIALLVAGPVLVCAFVWQLHRITRRQQSEIQGEVKGILDELSRLFVMQLRHPTENAPLNLTLPPPPHPTAKNNGCENDPLPQLEMEFEMADIDQLCAKLITLVPPKEAGPLLSPVRPPSEARERLRLWPQQ